MSEKGGSSLVQVVIALITVLGSLGVAYITTGYQFKKELQAAQSEVTYLKTQGQKIDAKQSEVEQRIAELTKLLNDAEAKNTQLQDQLVTKNNELEQKLAALHNEIEQSKQDITVAKNGAIGDINQARIKAMSTMVKPTQ